MAPSRTGGSFLYLGAHDIAALYVKVYLFDYHRSDRDISDLGRKETGIVLYLPDEKTTYYPIASLMVSQLYELLVHQSDERGGRLKNRVNFIMENSAILQKD